MTKATSLIVYLLITIIGRLFSGIGRRQNKQESIKTIKDIFKEKTALISSAVVFLVFLISILEPAVIQRNTYNIIPIIIGSMITLGGWIISFCANTVIGKNWSASIKKDDNQELTMTGIYRFIRHPLYLSGLLILFGTNIFFSNKIGWIGFILVLITIAFRIPLEEKELIKKYGETYNKYIGKTKMLFPFIL